MSDITTGYTWSDDKANWENNEATSIRLNKMMDDADVNILAGSNITVTRSSSGITIASTAPGTGTVTSVAATAGTGITVSGSPITTSGTLTITNSAPDQTVAISAGTGISVSGTYPSFTVTNSSPSSGGTVTSVATGTGLTGGPITTSGTVTLANTAVTAGAYTNSNITVDAQGRLTSAANGSAGGVTSVTGTAPVVSSGGATPAISMAAATTSVNGYLTSTDWTTFNNKGSGTVTSVAATVPSVFSISGSPITTSGTLAMTYSGTALPQANGGTGQTTLGAGTYTATGGTTAISLADRSAQVFNVKDFGALGDNSTNDSTAINAAIAALNSATYGGCLYFPVGTYKITATLTTITNNCNILGQGQGVSQLSFQGAIDGININFTSTGRRTATVNNLSLSSDQARTQTGLTYKQYNNSVLGNPFNFNNLTFNENWYISINVDNTALNNIQGGTIENVFISGSNSSPFPEYGIKLSGASNVTISDCAIFWSKNGIYINNSPLCEGTIISNCTVVNCKNGFDSLGTNTWLTNCYANVSATVGTGGSAFILAGNESHSSNCYCTGDDGTATGMTISGDQTLVHNLRVLRAGGGRWSYGIQCSGNVNLIQNCLLLNITNAAVYFLAAADFCTAESISFNDVLGASAIANSGTNCFARSCFGLGSNTDNYWNSKPYS